MAQYLVMTREGVNAATAQQFCNDLNQHYKDSKPFSVCARVTPNNFGLSVPRDKEKEFVVITCSIIEDRNITSIEELLADLDNPEEVDGNTFDASNKDWYAKCLHIGPERTVALELANNAALLYIRQQLDPRKR